MVVKRDISHFSVLDWNFAKEDSRHFLHNFCWYPSRFIPIIPAHLLLALSKDNETVLDPFCGVGTTVIEALKLNRNAIGSDINPVGTFIAQVKAKILTGKKVNIKKIKDFNIYLGANEDLLFSTKKIANKLSIQEDQIPNIKENSEWYNEETLLMLAAIHNYIDNDLSGLTKDVCKTFFISILMNSVGFPKEQNYAYYADNVKPKNGKVFKNSFKLFQNKLIKFINDYEIFLQGEISQNDFSIYNADAKNIHDFLTEEVDLVVTSPPYLNVTDYTTAFRLAYLWYDFLPNDSLIRTKQKEIGARWRRKQSASMNAYVDDMEKVLIEVSECLKKNRYLCLVLGESKKYSDVINAKIIKILTSKLNYELVDNFTRDISKKFFIHPTGGGVQTEEIFIFRKRG